jgi:PAS domain S-box-containing protein
MEAVLSAILENGRELVYAFTPELRYVFVTESAARVFGTTPDEMIGRTWDEVVSPELTAEQKRHVARVVATRQPLREEILLPGAEGPRYFDCYFSPLLDARGEVDFIVSLGRDITDRKRVELALVEANARTVQLQALTSALSGALTRAQVIEVILRHSLPLLGASVAAAFFVDDEGRALELAGSQGVEPEELRGQAALSLLEPLPACRAFWTGQPVWLETREQLRHEFPQLVAQAERTGRQAMACLPMLVRGRAAGVLVFGFQGEHVFSEQDRASVMGLVEQSTQALERTQLHESERKARARFETLARISDALAQARLDLHSLLRAITDEIAATLGDGCTISLLSEDGEFLYQPAYRLNDPEAHALYGARITGQRFPKDEGLTGRIMKAGLPVLLPALNPEQVLQGTSLGFRELVERYPLYSLMGVPLRAEGRILGMIAAARYTPGRPYAAEDLELIEAIAQRASWAIANVRQHEALQAERRRLLRLQELTAALAATKTPEEVASVAIEHGLATLEATRGGVWLLERGGQALELASARGYSAESFERFGRMPLEGPLLTPVKEAFLRGEALFIGSEAELRQRYPELVAATSHLMPTFATACVPLIVEGRSQGLLNFVFDTPRRFTQEDQAFLGIIARLCAQALERTRLYEAEQAARAEAEAQRAYLHRLFEQLPVAVSVFSGAGLVCALSNTAAQRLLGGRLLLGRPIREAQPELEGQGLFEILERVFQTGEPYFGVEVPVRYRYGAEQEPREGFFNLVYQAQRNGRGEVEAIVTFSVEVTEQVLARRRVEEFLAMLGHELRNPLAPILTALQLMELRAGDALRKERAVIERQVRHVVRLVDDLLDVSRITRGKIELKRRPLELSEIVAKAVEMVSPLLEGRRHRLALSVPPGLIVEADEHRLAQITGNLLTNAAKYTEPGGHILVSALPSEGGVALSIRDSGVGIGPELLPRVFEPFIQSARTLDRAQGGLGLGLAIVRNLVELHGGHVRVESEGLGKGSTFTVWLPLSERGPHEAPEVGAPAALPVIAQQSSLGHILLVDDNRDAVEALAEGLEAFGYRVTVAFDGPGGLEAAARQCPDLALLDIGLPVLDGYELARRLRELPEMRMVPLVALTGYGQDTDRQRALEAGFQEHLVKPVELSRLRSLLQRLVSQGAGSAGGGA